MDEIQLSSPISRNESKFCAEDSPEKNRDVKKPTGSGLGKLKALSNTINQWEDEVTTTSSKVYISGKWQNEFVFNIKLFRLLKIPLKKVGSLQLQNPQQRQLLHLLILLKKDPLRNRQKISKVLLKLKLTQQKCRVEKQVQKNVLHLHPRKVILQLKNLKLFHGIIP